MSLPSVVAALSMRLLISTLRDRLSLMVAGGDRRCVHVLTEHVGLFHTDD